MDSLQWLDVSSNNFSGPLPVSLGNAGDLRALEMHNSGFSGTIPSQLGQLAELWSLDLANNQLSGALPVTLGGLKSMEELHLENNNLSGPIPAELGKLAKLRKADFYDNRLSGNLPDTLSGWKSVETLDLDNNKFTGTLKPLSNLTSLRQLRVANKSFEGHLPVGFQTLKRLTEIYAANNRHSGLRYHSLRRLDLSSNRLNGSIDLSAFPNLERIVLYKNRITGFADNGSIPESLVYLNLSGNLLSALPESFRSMPKLEVLALANNRISKWPDWGSTSEGVCYMPHTGILTIRKGGFDGLVRTLSDASLLPPPPDWGSLQQLDVSNNPIHVDVIGFFMPLKWQSNLDVLLASNCSIHGELHCEAFFAVDREALALTANTLTPLTVDNLRFILSDNNISSIDLYGLMRSPLFQVDFDNNSLVRVAAPSDLWKSLTVQPYRNARLTNNPDLRSGQTPICISFPDIKDIKNLPHALDNGEERFECTEFCSVFNQVEVDYIFASDALCRCLPGYEGIGINCTKCPAGTYSNRQVKTQTCKQCPDDAGSDEGSTTCYCRLGHQRGDEPCEPCTAGSVGVRKSGRSGGRDTWICQDCLPGLNCSVPINYNASVLPGFFQLTVQLESDRPSHNTTREVTTYGAGLTLLPIVMRCPLSSACKGTNKTDGLNICSEGHEGFVCSRCKAGFSRQTPQQPCVRCAPL
ncbi:unnamed protein product [Vitrella brassicaformis CCMP3155]|uniref:EGF-like domain-containing protein n=1 Tax=Vitrella brassicaformis (strain CCMP3155) TaxID=1169540 RepID=A0A0G4EJ39_VITBC|nr:unnamed protein product [Vitrella brassicaformis CCMP3155]|eukprot:CEL95924.1 unnamed protein product [Vitrella brassicaformis CCMP3155]